jgi:hypothetical protein
VDSTLNVKMLFLRAGDRLVTNAHRLASNLNTTFCHCEKTINERINLTQIGAYQRRTLISGLISLTGNDWHIRGLTRHKLPVCQPLLYYIEKRKKIKGQPKSKKTDIRRYTRWYLWKKNQQRSQIRSDIARTNQGQKTRANTDNYNIVVNAAVPSLQGFN